MKDLIKKWWFWLIVVILSIITVTSGSEKNKNTNQTYNNSNVLSYIENLKEDYNNNQKLKENPYKTTKEFDGVYKFVLNSNNGSGHRFTSKGIISFENGICKAKYLVSSDTLSEYIREQEGFCGIKENSNSEFYFTLNDDKNYELISYQCILSDKKFLCKLISEYDLSGCYSDELILTYVDNLQDVDKALEQVKAEEEAKREAEEKAKKEQEEKEFKASCQTYTFEQMARNPDNFKGTNVKITGEVVQVIEGLYSNGLRVNITPKGAYSTYYTDTIYVNYVPEKGEDKILEDDIITIYGTAQGDYSYTSTLGAIVTLPFVYGKYITIENKN